MARGVAVAEKVLDKEATFHLPGILPVTLVLPCLLYYCKLCVLSTAKISSSLVQSVARKSLSLAKNKTNSQTAFFVNRFKVMSTKKETTLSKEDMKCEICTTSRVKAEPKITLLPVTLVVNKITFQAEVNKISKVMLYTTRLLNNKPTKCAVQIDCRLMSLCNGSRIRTNAEEIGADQYRVLYIPTVRGRHELTVSVDGQQVAGSPFPVFVSIPLTQLDKPVKVWDGLMSPISITVNSEGEIIITEFLRVVVVMDQHGERLRSIDCSVHQFVFLHCVSVDSEDNIYVAGIANQVLKANKNCSNVQVFEVKVEKGPGHYAVAVVGDEVMLIEYGNEGSVMVYDRELNYVRKIISIAKTKFIGLSADSRHNVYVSSVCGNSAAIQVFSNKGEFLRSFGRDENGVKRLKSPCGVCVAGQYVYVADEVMNKIVVFTTEGDYVTSFGDSRYGMVCVDNDGFVYACYVRCNRIDIY